MSKRQEFYYICQEIVIFLARTQMPKKYFHFFWHIK
jgi:hypothetical protein